MNIGRLLQTLFTNLTGETRQGRAEQHREYWSTIDQIVDKMDKNREKEPVESERIWDLKN